METWKQIEILYVLRKANWVGSMFLFTKWKKLHNGDSDNIFSLCWFSYEQVDHMIHICWLIDWLTLFNKLKYNTQNVHTELKLIKIHCNEVTWLISIAVLKSRLEGRLEKRVTCTDGWQIKGKTNIKCLSQVFARTASIHLGIDSSVSGLFWRDEHCSSKRYSLIFPQSAV